MKVFNWIIAFKRDSWFVERVTPATGLWTRDGCSGCIDAERNSRDSFEKTSKFSGNTEQNEHNNENPPMYPGYIWIYLDISGYIPESSMIFTGFPWVFAYVHSHGRPIPQGRGTWRSTEVHQHVTWRFERVHDLEEPPWLGCLGWELTLSTLYSI